MAERIVCVVCSPFQVCAFTFADQQGFKEFWRKSFQFFFFFNTFTFLSFQCSSVSSEDDSLYTRSPSRCIKLWKTTSGRAIPVILPFQPSRNNVNFGELHPTCRPVHPLVSSKARVHFVEPPWRSSSHIQICINTLDEQPRSCTETAPHGFAGERCRKTRMFPTPIR